MLWVDSFIAPKGVDDMMSLLALVHHILQWIFSVLQPYIKPICFIIAWSSIALAIWQVVATFHASVAQAQRMHQIPCANCKFFTGDYHLKCPVHPREALSEAAIDCMDFESDNGMTLAS